MARHIALPFWSRDHVGGTLNTVAETFISLYASWLENKDEYTFNGLLQHFDPLVFAHARTRLVRSTEFLEKADLIAIGREAVWMTLDSKFKPPEDIDPTYKYNKLCVYLDKRVPGSMLDYIRTLASQDGFVRGTKPKAERRLGILVSADDRDSDDEGSLFDNNIYGLPQNPVFHNVMCTELLEKMCEVSSGFSQRHQRIMELYLTEAKNLAEIGKELGISEGLVCQMFRQALKECVSVLGETAESLCDEFHFSPKEHVNPQKAAVRLRPRSLEALKS